VNELTVISDKTNVIGTLPASTEINIQTVTPINNMAREVVGGTAARPAASSAKTQTTAKAATAVPKTPVPVVNQYWVQVAAFTTTEKTVAPKKSADTVRGALEENLIPVEVFTYTGSDGKLGYRVRVGPYETKNEAESVQVALRHMKNFENTQTFVVTVPKS
jgi:cell division protein FtsN